jgi:ferredoxin-NADP reductase
METVVMEFETNVKDIILRTYNVKSFRFPRPESLDYKPGQFMFVTIKIAEEKVQKHFTISSSPTEKGFIEFTKKLTGHEFSNAIDALKVGDWAKIDAPYGDFTFEGEFKKIGMLSGGIGITPLRSMCRYCTDMILDTKITLLYGNRTEKDIIFREELEKMQRQNKSLKVVFTVSEVSESWTGYTGRIDAEMIKKEIPDYMERVFYTCGPPAMVKAMENLLKDIKVPKKNIKKEDFPGY